MGVGTLLFSGLFDTRNAVDFLLDDTERIFPDNDFFYGPYDSLDEAFTALSTTNSYDYDSLVQGKTVGIITDGRIKEYWLEGEAPEGGYTVNDLVEKSAAPLPPSSESDYSLVIKLEDYGVVNESVFETQEAVFSYYGKNVQMAYIYPSPVTGADKEALVFHILTNNYRVYDYVYGENEEGDEIITGYKLVKEYDRDNPAPESVKNLFITGETIAYVKRVTGLRNDKIDVNAYRVFVGASGKPMQMKTVVRPVTGGEDAEYLLLMDESVITTNVLSGEYYDKALQKTYYIYKKDATGKYVHEDHNPEPTAPDWVKEAFQSGKTYEAGLGITIDDDANQIHVNVGNGLRIGDGNTLMSTWNHMRITKDDLDNDEGYYIECSDDYPARVLDWRGETDGLNVYCRVSEGDEEDSPLVGTFNELVIYFKGDNAPTLWDKYGTVGDWDIRSGYEYIVVIQDGIVIAEPISVEEDVEAYTIN